MASFERGEKTALTRQCKYPEESRRQATAQVLKSGRTIREVGREWGADHETELGAEDDAVEGRVGMSLAAAVEALAVGAAAAAG